MKLFAVWIWICAAAAVASCTHPLPPTPPPAGVDSGAPYADGGATCRTACETIFALGCADLPGQCVDACENVQTSGVFAYDVACITAATSCAGVDACQRTDNARKGN